MQTSSYTTVDVSSSSSSLPSSGVYARKRTTVLKALTAIGACALCVVAGVQLERRGHATHVESLFASTAAAPVSTTVTASLRTNTRRGGKTPVRAAVTRPARRSSSRIYAEGENAEAPATTEGEEAKEGEDAGQEAVYKTSGGINLPFEPKMSAALPFLENPPHLDGTMVGDRGFDPFNFGNFFL